MEPLSESDATPTIPPAIAGRLPNPPDELPNGLETLPNGLDEVPPLGNPGCGCCGCWSCALGCWSCELCSPAGCAPKPPAEFIPPPAPKPPSCCGFCACVDAGVWVGDVDPNGCDPDVDPNGCDPDVDPNGCDPDVGPNG